MAKNWEIVWHGKPGADIFRVATDFSKILASEGKYVQAFPELANHLNQQTIMAYNRISDQPIRIHSEIHDADLIIIADPELKFFKYPFSLSASDETIYLINSPNPADQLSEKLGLNSGQFYIFNLDLDSNSELNEVVPYIPIMALVVKYTKLLSLEDFKQNISGFFTTQHSDDEISASLKAIDAILDAVEFK